MDILVNGELMLYGTVGRNFWEDDGFTASDVINALATMRGQPVTVRINSAGGYTHEGTAIYNALAMHNGEVTVYIDSMAASAASLIAMAGKKIIMRRGASMMIHDPWVMAEGDAEELRKDIEYLETVAEGMATIYAARTGRDRAECRADMKEEIWLTAEAAVEKGYADETADEPASEAIAFDYRIYAKAPEPLRALAATKGWQYARRTQAAHAAPTTKETPMTTPVTDVAAAVKEATDRALAITEACTTAGVAAMAAVLIKEGATIEQAKARIATAKDIREAVALANKSCAQIDLALADSYIAAGASVDKVRADMFDKIVAVQAATPTNSPHNAGTGPTAEASIAASWTEAAAKANKMFGFTPRA